MKERVRWDKCAILPDVPGAHWSNHRPARAPINPAEAMRPRVLFT
jgi:hypothetical protein